MTLNTLIHLNHRLWIVACTVLMALPAQAQETDPEKTIKNVKIKQATRISAKPAAMDPEAALRASIEQCGARCMIGGPGDIAAPGGTLDYNCDENGNCACFGASDCVKMSDICKEDTIGCNDQGCICEEG